MIQVGSTWNGLRSKKGQSARLEARLSVLSVLLFPDMAPLPELDRAAVDLLVELKPPTIALMKGVFHWRDKVAITDTQAEIFLCSTTT